MNGQAIPGYYWDADKKKYFKIQSQNAARGFDLKYSLDNIRKEERKQRKQKAVAARSDKIRKERVVRRNPNSITQTNIDRELGSKRHSFYFSNLWADACAFGIDTRPKQVVRRRADYGPIRLFDLDTVSGAVYTAQGSNCITMQNQSKSPHHYHQLTRTNSTVSSLTYLPVTGTLAVTTYGSNYVPEVLLCDPGTHQPVSHRPDMQTSFCFKTHKLGVTVSTKPNNFFLIVRSPKVCHLGLYCDLDSICPTHNLHPIPLSRKHHTSNR